MTANPARILRDRTVTCMVGTDNIEHITQRVRNLLAADRRITIADRYVHTNGTPDVTAGLTVTEIRAGREGGIGVHLGPGRHGFGIHPIPGETEANGWARFHREYREGLTRVDINGGLPGDHPAPTDRLTIRHWISDRVCREWVVVFDDAPDIRQDVENLEYLLGKAREFLDGCPALTDEMARVRDILAGYEPVVRRA